jgi:hypothetical protein
MSSQLSSILHRRLAFLRGAVDHEGELVIFGAEKLTLELPEPGLILALRKG